MISLNKRQSGFTIVELLIVIVIIGILATLVIVTFSGIQQKARDSQRKTDINAVQSHVEAYYAQNGYYPTLADLQDSSFRSANMKGLDPEALVDPKGGSIQGTADATHYSYVASGTSCVNTTASGTGNACDSYALTAKLESSSTDYVKQSN